MASTANNSHATSSAVDEENWKYVECAKCREEAIIQDKEDPNNHTLRADFHLTACGHIACEKCLQASIGQDGSQMCPRCEAPLQDWVSLQAAQQHSSLATYFRSVEGVLAELTQAMRFQTSNLREQAAYYKGIAHKQSAAIRSTKKELAELRLMKKSYEALQRENTALKNQLAGAPKEQTSPLLQSDARQEPLQQAGASTTHQRQGHQPITMPPLAARPQMQRQHGLTPDMQMHSISSPHDTSHGQVPQYPLQTRPSSRMQTLNGPQQSTKRSAPEAGLSLPPSTLPPRLRESQLPGFAMSSAQVQQQEDARRESEAQAQDDGVLTIDAVDRLQSFRSQAGRSNAHAGRSASRQASRQSPRDMAHATRRSSSRSSRGELPAIEETPFQKNSIRGQEAHLPEPGSSRYQHSHHQEAQYHTSHENQYGQQSFGGHHNVVQAQQVYQNPSQPFVPASAMQPAAGFNQSLEEGRYNTFRPLVARPPTNTAQLDSSHHQQPHQSYISPPTNQQRPFLPATARPATAQAGNASNPHYSRPSIQTNRPATAQGGRRSSHSGTSSAIRPMAMRPLNAANGTNSGSTFRFQPG